MYELIHEDEHLLVVHKPAGWLTIPDRAGNKDSLLGALEKRYGKVFVVRGKAPTTPRLGSRFHPTSSTGPPPTRQASMGTASGRDASAGTRTHQKSPKQMAVARANSTASVVPKCHQLRLRCSFA